MNGSIESGYRPDPAELEKRTAQLEMNRAMLIQKLQAEAELAGDENREMYDKSIAKQRRDLLEPLPGTDETRVEQLAREQLMKEYAKLEAEAEETALEQAVTEKFDDSGEDRRVA